MHTPTQSAFGIKLRIKMEIDVRWRGRERKRGRQRHGQQQIKSRLGNSVLHWQANQISTRFRSVRRTNFYDMPHSVALAHNATQSRRTEKKQIFSIFVYSSWVRHVANLRSFVSQSLILIYVKHTRLVIKAQMRKSIKNSWGRIQTQFFFPLFLLFLRWQLNCRIWFNLFYW